MKLAYFLSSSPVRKNTLGKFKAKKDPIFYVLKRIFSIQLYIQYEYILRTHV